VVDLEREILENCLSPLKISRSSKRKQPKLLARDVLLFKYRRCDYDVCCFVTKFIHLNKSLKICLSLSKLI
jgi:hypothetical protein